jgi:predicted AlkP superfamily phosphohydrolase/phosphomutase
MSWLCPIMAPKRMDGGICVNEWLIANGYLTLSEKPSTTIPFSKAKIDWSKTKAWGDGGYYARIFLNVAGREPEGTISKNDYEKVRDELIAGLNQSPMRMEGQSAQWFLSRGTLQARARSAPDLTVYFGALYWRSAGTVGGG